MNELFYNDDMPIADENMAASPLVHEGYTTHAQTDTEGAIHVDRHGAKRRLSFTSNNSKPSKRSLDYRINNPAQDVGPQISFESNGSKQGYKLSHALKQKRGMIEVSLILKANPEQARVEDRHLNYPLHIACMKGASLPVIELLVWAYPQALDKRNFHDQTPLDIAHRNARSSDQVIDFLQKMSFAPLEERAIHLHA
jgi:ankyrin repeat protein